MPQVHSNLRADDWRSPLVRRLIGCDNYADGSTTHYGQLCRTNKLDTIGSSADHALVGIGI